MAKLPLSTWLSDPARQTVSLDLSGRFIRFVRLRRRGRGAEVVRFGSVPLPPDVIQNGLIANPTRLQQQLTALLDAKLTGKPKPQATMVAISERHTFLKFLEVPSGANNDFNEAVRWEATQYIPYELKELNLDWVALPAPAGNATGALVVAAPRELIESYATIVERVGLTPLAIEPSSLAAVRVFAGQLPTRGSSLLVLLGERESSATLVQASIPLFTAMVHLTTDELEQQVAMQFKLPPVDAQRALYVLGFYKSRARGIVRELLRERVAGLVNRLQEIVAFYGHSFTAPVEVTTILICGPGAHIAGLSEELESRLKLTVTTARLPTGIRLSKTAASFPEHVLEYSVALGGSLRLINGSTTHA